MPFTGNLNFFSFGDFRTHCNRSSSLFVAGNTGWGKVSSTPVTVNYSSWSDREIVINGFSGSYGEGCATVQDGDPVVINVWNTGATDFTGPQTAWGGFATQTASNIFTLTTLASFNGANGRGPVARLLQTADGSFYGTTYYGGPYDSGTIFRMSRSGTLMSLFSCGLYGGVGLGGDKTYGTHFAATPLQGADGNFYIPTVNDGPTGWGAILRMTPSGSVTTIASLNGANGQFGGCSLIAGADGNFYGYAGYGGAEYDGSWGSGNGTVYSVTPSGALSVLHSFSGTDGSKPSGVTLGSDGNVYGVTGFGAIGWKGINHHLRASDDTGYGTVFKVTPSGSFTLLYSFTGGSDGARPERPLALGTDGNFYGTTWTGGAMSNGTVFKITPSGQFTSLYSFSGDRDGAKPVSTLVQGSDGNFYGTTYSGGASGKGTVFRVTPSGRLTTLYSFTGGADGANPNDGLILANDGNFYGTTSTGGAYGNGTAFKVSVPLDIVSANLVAPVTVATAPASAPAMNSQMLNSGLIAYYPFDENANDASGNGRDATLMNSPSFVNGIRGSAIYLKGNGEYGTGGQYVQLPPVQLTDYPAFTIALWAKIDGNTSPLGSGEGLITFGSQGVGCSGVIAIQYSIGSAGGELNFVSGGGPDDYASVRPVPASCVGHWAHYALVYDKGMLTGFINGEAVAAKANVTAGQFGTTAGLGIHWWRNNPFGVSTRFVGAIDEVRIYSRALSRSELAQLAQPAQDATVNIPAGVQDVVKLTKAGMGEELILTKVKQVGVSYDLTTDQVIYLKNQGVSQNVITALLQAGPASAPSVFAPPSSASLPPPATPSATPDNRGTGRGEAPSEEPAGMPLGFGPPQENYLQGKGSTSSSPFDRGASSPDAGPLASAISGFGPRVGMSGTKSHAPASQTTTVVERYPTVECDDQVVVDKEFAVQISLTEGLVARAVVVAGETNAAGQIVLRLPNRNSWKIDVVVSAPAFTFRDGANIGTMNLPLSGDSTPSVFYLRPKPIQDSQEQAKIYATLWHDGVYLAKIEREVTVVDEATTSVVVAVEHLVRSKPAQPTALSFDLAPRT